MLSLRHVYCLLVASTLIVYLVFVFLSKNVVVKLRRLPSHYCKKCNNRTFAKKYLCQRSLQVADNDKPLSSLLLAINFNHPFYDNIPVLENFYKPVFQTYVFCGPEFDKSGQYDIIKIPQRKEEYGYYGFQCLVEAIRRHPGYTGYLYVNDDMIVNWWNFLSLDKTKIWFGAPKFSLRLSHVMGLRSSGWFQRKANCGDRCSETFAAMEKSIRFNRTDMFKIYFKNTKNKRICIHALSDIFYVPARHAKQFEMIGQAFYDNLVFLEVSAPMSLILLDDIANIIFIDGMYLQRKYGWSTWTFKTDRAWKEYNFNTYFLHPYKFIGENKTKNTGEFKAKVASISQEILHTKCLDVVKKIRRAT